MRAPLRTRKTATAASCLAALAFMLLAGVAPAESAEEAIRRLHAKSQEVETAHFTQIITSRSQMMESTSTSEVWQKRGPDGTTRMRTEMKSEMTMKGMEMEPTRTEAILVMDGDHVWSEIDNMGTVMVTKMKVPPESQQGLEFLLEYLEKGDGRLLEPETIDGKECVVIEYNMDDAMGGMTVLQRSWIAEEHGMMLKSLTKGGELSGDTEMLVKDVRIGIEIDDSKFTYTPPEGVQVMDYSEM